MTKVADGETLVLDLLLAAGPLEPMWARTVELDAVGRRMRVVSRDALLEMKALAGRLQDLADIERLSAGGEA